DRTVVAGPARRVAPDLGPRRVQVEVVVELLAPVQHVAWRVGAGVTLAQIDRDVVRAAIALVDNLARRVRRARVEDVVAAEADSGDAVERAGAGAGEGGLTDRRRDRQCDREPPPRCHRSASAPAGTAQRTVP